MENIRLRLNDTIVTYLHKHKNGEISFKLKCKPEDLPEGGFDFLHRCWNDGTLLEVLITEFQSDSAFTPPANEEERTNDEGVAGVHTYPIVIQK